MGGSGSGGPFVYRSPEELQDKVKKQEERTRDVAFETEIGNELIELLRTYNARDPEEAKKRLSELSAILSESLCGPFEHLYGGSVAKHTFVSGLSDVDALMIIDDSQLDEQSPNEALRFMQSAILRELSDEAEVTRGRMAVTVDYGGDMVIQVLPALRASDGAFRVPSSRKEDAWSRIDPLAFQQALSRRNAECAGKLVPTIKLAKAIIGQLPEGRRLSGYHIEALAISAFREYDGVRSTVAMLPTFFERARALVLRPIKDRTEQSVHVDGYLGKSNSAEREAASHLLGRIARRMRNATAHNSKGQWLALFGLDE